MSDGQVLAIPEARLRIRPAPPDLEELAGSLGALPHLILVIPPDEFPALLEGLRRSVAQNGSRAPLGDGDEPRGAGLVTAEGEFVPCLFTREDLARNFAAGKGLTRHGAPLSLVRQPPAIRLRRHLVQRHASLILDAGSASARRLERVSVARLYALLTRDAFVSSRELHVLTRRGRVLLLPSQAGMCAFVFESPGSATAAIAQLDVTPDGLEIRSMAASLLLEVLLGEGVAQLVVDATLPTQRGYTQADLSGMLERIASPPVNPT